MMEQKNLILAVVLSIVILLGYNFLIAAPQAERKLAAERAAEQQAGAEAQPAPGAPPALGDGQAVPQLGVTHTPTAPAAAAAQTREAVLATGGRIRIDTPRVSGSIALQGGRIDDIVLKDYRTTVDSGSPNIALLWPTGTEQPYYADHGWLAQGVNVPGPNTQWQADGQRLTPDTPVTLTWDNGAGLVFEKQFAIDRNFMITVTQRVRNAGAAAVSLAPYGLVSRTGTPHTDGYFILHEGLLGVFDGKLKEIKYKDLVEEKVVRQPTTGGWLGITDKYWLVALVPDAGSEVRTSFVAGKRGSFDQYQADYLGDARQVAPGETVESVGRVFAGAKEAKLLDRYEETLGVARFDLAVDFGWFYFLTKPMFLALDWLNTHLGNFGLAIMALTVIIKLLFYPLANKSYRAMNKMKLLQPKMQQLRERHGDDRARMNQELMGLYRSEGVNPAAGCLPVLIQIPVFFALYKVIFVTIEMRHAAFYGWIKDLSAPDPLGLLTLFGLVPWDVPTSLGIVNIGLWPIIMGITMFLQMRLNPAPQDPIQAKIFMFMPLIFTFVLAPFPAGLVIYWAWNNVLSMGQQWAITKQMGTSKA
ncbi:MAG: membrane protein insertase YidC [Alphaproteobacteria bacterium]